MGNTGHAYFLASSVNRVPQWSCQYLPHFHHTMETPCARQRHPSCLPHANLEALPFAARAPRLGSMDQPCLKRQSHKQGVRKHTQEQDASCPGTGRAGICRPSPLHPSLRPLFWATWQPEQELISAGRFLQSGSEKGGDILSFQGILSLLTFAWDNKETILTIFETETHERTITKGENKSQCVRHSTRP